MFGTIMHINLIRQLLKFLNELLNILHNDIRNGITCLFVFLWPYNGIETQRGNQPLSWSTTILFWIWICDFHILQTNKIQRYVHGDVLLTIFDIPVFTNIATTAIFHVHQCEIFLSKCLPSGATMINRRWCYNC